MTAGAGSPADDPMLGLVIAEKFVLRQLIGTGGMGKVYRADQLGVGRSVAVKIMHRHLMGDETAGARFTNEARAASQLNHPNSISVLDFGQTQQGFLYIVYEYLRGKSLDAVNRGEFPLPFERVADILCQATEAVQAAHELGIIHRDLKPENVFLVQSRSGDFVKVLDFGIAKLQAHRDRSITSPGMVPGTPEYMSPEQARGDQLGPTSDVYSLGIILYELLTGAVPFSGESVVAIMMAHVQDPPVPPSQVRRDGSIPQQLEQFTLRALSKHPTQRFPSALAFGDALAQWAAGAGARPHELADLDESPISIVPRSPTSHSASVLAVSSLHLLGGSQPSIDMLPPLEELPPTEMPMVGRVAEMATLEQFLTRSRGGRMLRLHGLEGMGKHRMADEIQLLAHSSGRTVLRGTPDPGHVAQVLGPLRRVAMQCLGLAESDPVEMEALLVAASRLGLSSAEIPGLRDLFGLPGHLSQMPPASRLRERTSAFGGLLRQAAAGSPLLVLLEGFDEYDEASRNLVTAIASSMLDQELDLALVLTHRSELTWGWPAAAQELELHPLDETASEQLVRSLFNEPLDDELVRAVCAGAGGLPLLLEQLAFSRILDGETDIPERLADLLAVRTQRLSGPEREIVQWLAVVNDWMTGPTLARLSRSKVDGALLEQLKRRGLLQSSVGAEPAYCFVHPLVARVTYSSIPAEVRRTIHRAMLNHLRRRDAPVAILAHHAYEAETVDAADALELTATNALEGLDDNAAAWQLSRALAVVRREWGRARLSEDALEGTAVRLARQLAQVLVREDQAQMARGVLEEALSSAGVARSRAELRLDLARVDLEQGRLERAMRHLELARDDAEQASPYLLGEILRELGRAAGLLGEMQRAKQLLEQSVTASRAARGPEGEPDWDTLLALASVSKQLELGQRARGFMLDALREAENANSLPGRLLANAAMARTHMGNSEWDEAEIRLEKALDLVAQVGDRSLEAELRVDKGRMHRIRGDVERARQELDLALQLAGAVGYAQMLQRAEREVDMLRYGRPQAL